MGNRIVKALKNELPHINVNRILIYCAGMTVLAVGLTLNAKAGLGVSPVFAVSYSGSKIFGISLGDAMFVFYTLCIVMQIAVRRMKNYKCDLLQLPFSVVFSRVMNLFDVVFSYDCAAHSFASNFVVLLAGVTLTGIGIAATLNMRLIPNPADGAMQALSDASGVKAGTMKNIFDACCCAVTASMCFAAGTEIIGISIGTVVCIAGVGRVIAVVNRFWMNKMLRAAGMDAAR